LKNVIINGEGNSAGINFILINVLKDAGFDAYPVVLSSRDEGHLPSVNPSLDCINYFVVGITTPDSTTYYMDASRKNAPVNVLDEEYLVDRARAIRGTDGEQSAWVDLTHIVPNLNQTFSMIKFEDGKMIVNVTEIKNNQSAYEFRQNYMRFKNQDEFVESLQNRYGVTISNYFLQGLDSVQQPIVEKYTFTVPFDLSDSIAYINPLTIFQDVSNPFKAEKRDLPVEFDYPFMNQNNIMMILPKGYLVEALPNSEKSNIYKNDATYRYLLQKQDSSLQVLAVLSLNETLFPVSDYSYLRDFWAHWIAKNNQEIVLKKGTQ
jgi:hypothetical protein